jgi:hypothetical protein
MTQCTTETDTDEDVERAVAALRACRRWVNIPHPREPGKRIVGYVIDAADVRYLFSPVDALRLLHEDGAAGGSSTEGR